MSDLDAEVKHLQSRLAQALAAAPAAFPLDVPTETVRQTIDDGVIAFIIAADPSVEAIERTVEAYRDGMRPQQEIQADRLASSDADDDAHLAAMESGMRDDARVEEVERLLYRAKAAVEFLHRQQVDFRTGRS